MSSIFVWCLTLAVIYALLYFALGRAAFYPSKFPDGWWRLQSGLRAEDVWLRTADGVRIHAWWIPKPDAHFATLFLHGNAGNISYRLSHLIAISDAGSALLMLDYRGYGKSEGRPSETGLYADADAAYKHLLDLGYPPGRVLLHGESLGTAVAVDLASRRASAGVILEAPLSSGRDMASHVLPLIGPLLVWSFNSKRKIKDVRCPILVIHGDRDDVVPISLGRALFAAANEPKSFWTVAGAGHNNLLESAGSGYVQRLRTFYQSLQ